MVLRYARYKPFDVELPNKHEWQNGFNSDNERGLVWYTYVPKTSEGTGAGVYKWGSIKGNSFSLGVHSVVFQVEIQGPPKKCIHTLTKENSTLYNRLL